MSEELQQKLRDQLWEVANRLRGISRQNLFCFSNIKLCILDSIDLRIFSGVLDGLRNDLHTVDLFRLLRQKQGYRSDSTVEIPDRLISFTSLTCSMNKPERAPERPARFPATDKS